MTTKQTGALVFEDAAGEYYLLPLATLERGQIPAERKAEVERLIAEHQDDVEGYEVCQFTVGFRFVSIGTAAWMGQLAVDTASKFR